jgi:hypothetical protein
MNAKTSKDVEGHSTLRDSLEGLSEGIEDDSQATNGVVHVEYGWSRNRRRRYRMPNNPCRHW